MPWPWTKRATALKQLPIEITHGEMIDHIGIQEHGKESEFDYKPITSP